MSKEISYQDHANHIGNNYFGNVVQAKDSALEKVIQKILAASKENQELVDIIEELTEYVTAHPYREIIGLENKLKNGGRADLLGNAIRYKGKFARRVCKSQMSLTEQKVYVQILSHILIGFDQFVRPRIRENAPTSEVDIIIYEKIIEPAHSAIIEFDDEVTKELILGMLFFLTGKCHLVWDETC
ncbi:ABC-three component system protein [Neptuniibacter pectenicola]|uniref:ABC-three component system protein n=1 Tax=Neptuniibacter pectenicola TaxID=1806669 RepID=UPI00082D79ED|nr:ABC-three component system protein [Neptuniibacter pectenicola]